MNDLGDMHEINQIRLGDQPKIIKYKTRTIKLIFKK